MKIEIDLTDDQVDEITRLNLIESYQACTHWNDEILTSLKAVIEYYSSAEEYSEFLKLIGEGVIMTQTIYGLISDNGDGTSSMNWFKNKIIVDRLLSDDESEIWYQNEGFPSQKLTFPAELNLEECGFYFSDDDWKY